MGFFVIERITKNSQELDLYLLDYLVLSLGFPGGSDHKEFACSEGHRGSIPGSGRSPGERNGLLTPVFLPGEFQGQRSQFSLLHVGFL